MKEVDYKEWVTYFKECRQANMLQSWQYGAAKELTSKWRTLRFVIMTESSTTAGEECGRAIALAQFLVMELPFLGGIARMNRGPLFIGQLDSGQYEDIAPAVVTALLKEARRRLWWLVQIAPDFHNSTLAERWLQHLGLRRLAIAPSASGLLSLEPEEEQLMERLKGKWRNCLRKGLRSGVKVAVSKGDNGELEKLLECYHKLQENKGFRGISPTLISALAKQVGEDWQFNLFAASADITDDVDTDDSIGMLVSVHHGDTATYLIGTTNDGGRRLQANYVLLWQAILHAKRSGCSWFDIGGLNSSTPSGIAHFKQGVNADYYSLVGEWWRIILPWRSV